MAVYPDKRRPGVQRVVLWSKNKRHETTVRASRKEALAFEARWRLELEAGAPVVSKVAPTFSAFCLRYAVHAEAHLRASTWAVRRYQLATLEQHLGALKLTEIGTEAIDKYKATRTREGVKARTVNTEIAKLQAVLRYARETGVPCASPKVRRLPEIGRGRVTFWTAEQIASLLGALERDAPDLLGIVVFLANTGARKGEALACEQGWIDLKRGLLTIQPNDDWQPKNGEPREIPISDALRPWLERALATPGRYVFTTAKLRDGKRSRWATWPKRAFDRARAAAGLVGGPHTLRHSFAAAFLSACPDMFLLSQLLGHSHERVTRIYAHLLPAHLERARNAVNVSAGIGAAAADARRRWAR